MVIGRQERAAGAGPGPARRWLVAAVAAALLAAGVLVALFVAGGFGTGQPVRPGAGAGPGRMGQRGTGEVGSTPAGRQVALGNQVPASAVVDRTANRVVLTGPTADLVLVASPVQGPDLAFRTAGLTDPTVVVPDRVTVTVTVVNADREMAHSWVLADAAPPYPGMGTMMLAPAFAGAASTMLPEATGGAMPTQVVSFTADRPGTYHYLCTYPDHAARHMYGTLVVQAA